MSPQLPFSAYNELVTAIEEQQDRLLSEIVVPDNVLVMMQNSCSKCGFYNIGREIKDSNPTQYHPTSSSSMTRDFKRWKFINDNNLYSHESGRTEQAITLLKLGKPEHALIVIDTVLDRNNSLAFVVWAYCFNSSFNTKIYNPDLALALFILVSSISERRVEEEIAGLYEEGASGQVNIDATIYWLEQAIFRGSEHARQRLANIYKKYDNRYHISQNNDFIKYVNDLERVNIDNIDNSYSHYLVAKQYAAGIIVMKDEGFADSLYQSVIDLDPGHKFTGALALKSKVLRSYLGIQENDDILTIKSLINKYTGESSNCSGIRNKTNHAFDIIRAAISSLENDPAYFHQIKEWLKALDNGELQFEEAIEYVCGQNMIGDGFLYSVWAMYSLAELEERRKVSSWRELWLTTLARRNGLQIGDINRSTLEMGPTYNCVDESGLPVLGALLLPSYSHEEEFNIRNSHGFYTPRPGIVSFEELDANNDSIDFCCTTSECQPAFLMQEDFDVVIALVFGRKELVWPSLSIEKASSEIDDKAQDLKIKVWNPKWLASTDFGRTMYIVDSLIGALGWNAASFCIGDAGSGVDEEEYYVAEGVLTALRLAGGGCAGYCSGRVMLRPEHVPVTVNMRHDQASGPTWNVKVGRPKIMVDGAFMAKSTYDGPEDRNFALNDLRYRYGRTAHQLTTHYDAISELVPVFERFRQMMALLYAVAALREEKNFKPSAALTQKGANLVDKFQSGVGVSAEASRRVCRSLPLTWED